LRARKHLRSPLERGATSGSADLAEKRLGELATLRIVDLERTLGGVNQRPSDAAETERRRQVATRVQVFSISLPRWGHADGSQSGAQGRKTTRSFRRGHEAVGTGGPKSPERLSRISKSYAVDRWSRASRSPTKREDRER